MYGLSFSEEFFSGDGSVDIYEMEPSEYPTNVYQAIISLPHEEQVGIARDILNSINPEFYVDSEGFAFDVLDKVRETDLCDDLSSPVTVYVDPEQRYSVTVYEKDGPRKPYFVSAE